VHYISPEQARGDITDEKSDLYSVGIMMYEMLAGTKPFDGDDALAIALMHTNKRPKPPREINSSIPEGLEEIILRAMQKDAAQRYQTAGEMLGDLQEFEKNPSVIFEYKYATPDGETKHFNKVGKPAPNPVVAAKEQQRRVTPPEEEDDEYDEDEIIERRSPLLPILFAVASAFVIIAAVLITYVVGDMLDRSGRNRAMPDLVGEPWEAVFAEYGSWLNMRPTQEWSEMPLGHIVSQSERAGRMINPNQTIVDIVVSRGMQVVIMPDFSNRMHTGQEVMEALEQIGLVPVPNYVYHDTIPVDFFIDSDRHAGDTVDLGDSVRVKISLGREGDEGLVPVPNVMNMPQEEAEAALNALNLQVTFTFSDSLDSQLGLVINQSVPNGTMVDINSTVALVIGSGPAEEDPQRASFIEFNMPDSVSGTFVFELLRNGDVVDTITRNVSSNRFIRFDFSDTGQHRYSVNIVNRANNREGVFVSYDIDFTGDEAVKSNRTADPYVLTLILEQPQTTPTTTTPPTTTPPTEPPTTPTETSETTTIVLTQPPPLQP
jgi:serine/threonine-protein kinase